MRYRDKHPRFSLSGGLWARRIAMYFVTVFIVAMTLNWSSVAALDPASSRLEATSSAIEATTTNPDGIVKAKDGAVNSFSCAEDEAARVNHPGPCTGCCSFMVCGGFIPPVVAIADYPESHARFPLAAVAAPHNLQFPPIIRPPIFPFSI